MIYKKASTAITRNDEKAVNIIRRSDVEIETIKKCMFLSENPSGAEVVVVDSLPLIDTVDLASIAMTTVLVVYQRRDVSRSNS